MPTKLLRAIFAGALLASAVGAFAQTSAVGASAQAKPPVQTFFEHAAFADAQISPTGRHVAIKVAGKDGRVQLVVVDTATMDAKVAASSTEADVRTFSWVNDRRLVFTLTDQKGGSLFERSHSPGLFAVDRDGGDLRRLARVEWEISATTADRRVLDPSTRFFSAMRNRDSDDIYVTQAKAVDGTSDIESFNLLKVNTRTLDTQRILRPEYAWDYTLDEKDVPRIAETSRKGRSGMQYLDPATGKWEKVLDYDTFSGEGAISALGFTPDGTFYVTRDAGTGSAVYRFDLAKKQIDAEPLISAKGFDVHPRFIESRGRVLGVRYWTDAVATAWFDPEYKALQSKIDAALPGTINVINVPVRPEVPVVTVISFSDREPGIYSIYDGKTGKLTTLGRAMPSVDPATMGKRDFVRLKARDGLELPTWITTPKGSNGRKLPMVVLVHGGPWAQAARWGWDADSQFLASRGYAVLEPDFRGSIGYGFRHFKAGWKQWGLAMQDDVADATKWAIQQGIADPARICIAGASYGGYATLMGLAKDPDLYKCGVEWVGVTDIDLMYSITWSDFSDEYTRYGMPVLVGDRGKDAAQLKATSPLQIADKIRQPLLMAYGGSDVRVPIEHGLKFRDAVSKTNKDVEWVEYKEEGHGWYLVKNRVDFWTRVEKFLDRHIGH